MDRGWDEERGVPSGLQRTETAEPSLEGTPVPSIAIGDKDRPGLELDLDALGA